MAGELDRRSFLRFGLVAIAAPAIVRATSLMSIKAYHDGWLLTDGVALQSAVHPEESAITRALIESLRHTKLTAAARVLDREFNPDALETIELELQSPPDHRLWYGGGHGQ